MWTYYNPNFHKILMYFFGFGAVINGAYGLYYANFGGIFNVVMLGILSIMCYRLHYAYKLKETLK